MGTRRRELEHDFTSLSACLIKGRISTAHVREWGTEEDIWAQDGGSNTEAVKLV